MARSGVCVCVAHAHIVCLYVCLSVCLSVCAELHMSQDLSLRATIQVPVLNSDLE